jgi:mannitol-1-/sugar-/sorbitol-6-/2-deoxyglucose-6-phosphatase
MNIRSAIFDMDGLLIDSEPLWYEAAVEVFTPLGISLTPESYAGSIGLRTREFVAWWFSQHGIDRQKGPQTEKLINEVVISKISERGKALPGVHQVLDLLKKHALKIGLATSSPLKLIDVVVDKLGIRNYFDAFSSAEYLEYGKPHPQVFLDCAQALGTTPVDCLCFEDSYHGMIAAKAARMKCIIVPAAFMKNDRRWQAADLQLASLQELTDEMLLNIFR